MKKLTILFTLLFNSILLFSNSQWYFGLNLGMIGFTFTENEDLFNGSIVSLSTKEANSGIGFNLNISTFDQYNFYYDSSNDVNFHFLGPELVYEPLSGESKWFGAELFVGVDHLIFPDFRNWRTGVRLELRQPVDDTFTGRILPYPILRVEGGYSNKDGFFASAKVDLSIIILICADSIADEGDKFIPDGGEPVDHVLS